MQTSSAPPPKPPAPGPTPQPHAPEAISLVNVGIDPAKAELFVHGNAWAAGAIALAVVIAVALKSGGFKRYKALEIDEAEIGVGAGKVKLKPNVTDRQVAYQIWVELSTRKIGLAIDLEHDVISEIYDSWYNFFGVTRELIKSIPVSRVGDPSTRKIISMSIDVLNEGLRPHLTQWQARYRHWYEARLKDTADPAVEPQALQKAFPAYGELSADLMKVNVKLAAYRATMRDLVYGR